MQNKTILCAFILCTSMQAAQKSLLDITDASFKLLMSIPSNDQTRVLRAIKNGADVNFKEPSTGKTSLIRAAECAHLEIIKILINNKADVLCKDNAGSTALDYAKQHLSQAQQMAKILKESHYQPQTQINSPTHEETYFNRTLQEYADQLLFPSSPLTSAIASTPSSEQNFFQEDYTQE